MTDTSETQQYGIGDKITIMRGVDRNKVAEVIYVDKDREQYAVKFTDGAVAVVNWVNAKPPVEQTYTAAQIRQAAENTGYESGVANQILEALAKG